MKKSLHLTVFLCSSPPKKSKTKKGTNRYPDDNDLFMSHLFRLLLPPPPLPPLCTGFLFTGDDDFFFDEPPSLALSGDSSTTISSRPRPGGGGGGSRICAPWPSSSLVVSSSLVC